MEEKQKYAVIRIFLAEPIPVNDKNSSSWSLREAKLVAVEWATTDGLWGPI